MNTQTRERLLISMARQIAIFNGLVWTRLNHKQIANYMTLATNVLATVERVQRGSVRLTDNGDHDV